MPEKRPKISQEQPKGKLTPEEVKEMVKKYKKEHEGLLPEYFSLPGEEKEEGKEYSEETILAYEIKEFLEKMRPEIENENLIKNAEEELRLEIYWGRQPTEIGNASWAVFTYVSFKQSGLWPKLDQEFGNEVEKDIKNPQLIENAGKSLKFHIESGQKPGKTESALMAVRQYTFFKQSGLWPELDQESQHWIENNIKDSQLIKNVREKLKSDIESGQKPGKTASACASAWDALEGYHFFKQSGLWSKVDQEFQDWVEENIKNPQLIKNAEEYLKSDIESGQKPGKTMDARSAVFEYAFFSQFQKILEEQGRKKEAMKESQKAMHPEKKLPPMPEEKAF
jgi:hypothetical protein